MPNPAVVIVYDNGNIFDNKSLKMMDQNLYLNANSTRTPRNSTRDYLFQHSRSTWVTKHPRVSRQTGDRFGVVKVPDVLPTRELDDVQLLVVLAAFPSLRGPLSTPLGASPVLKRANRLHTHVAIPVLTRTT